MGREQTVLGIARRIYDATLDPGGWQPALSALTTAVGGDHGLLTVRDAGRGATDVVANVGVDPVALKRLILTTEAGKLPGFLQAIPTSVAVCSTALVRDGELERTDYYNEILRPDGVFYKIVAAQHGVSRFTSFVGVCRARRAGSFSAADVALLQALLPHFATALELRRRLREVETLAAGAHTALDRLSAGVILTDAAGQPCFLNTAAVAIIEAADGLTLQPSGLAAATARDTAALRRAIVAAGTSPIDGAAPAIGGRLALSRPSRCAPLVLHVLPIGMLDLSMPGQLAPRVAIFIRTVDRLPAIDENLLATSFDLTPRETALLVLLARGATLAEAAVALGVTSETARTYLKRTLDKTGTHRQAELVSLVLRGFTMP